jgi:hypothetical protein
MFSDHGDKGWLESWSQYLDFLEHLANCIAISRLTSREGLKILIIDKDGEDTNKTFNIVYKIVFRNISWFMLYENLSKFIVELMVNVTPLFHTSFN